MWRAQEVDGRIAAKNAVKIRAALRQSIDAKRIYAQYQETQPAVTDNPTQDRTRARAWAIMNVRFNNESLRTAMTRLYAEAWVTGDLAARAALLDMRKEEKALTKANDIDADVSTIDWDSWQPGDTASAMLLDPPQAFQNLVQRSGNLISGLDKTGYEQIGTALADAIRTGMPPGKAAKLIQDAVGSPARALTIAVTENSRVMNAAAVQRYKDAGIKQMRWMAVTAVGGAPCEKCASNIGQVVEIGASFNSGQMQPPAHPHCRCNLLPEIPNYEGYLNSLGYQVNPTDGGMVQVPNIKTLSNEDLLQIKAGLPTSNSLTDNVLQEIQEKQGFNGLPQLITEAEGELLKEQGWKPLFRGIGVDDYGKGDPQKYIREFKLGKHRSGLGMHGNGTYAADTFDQAVQYARFEQDGVIRMYLNPDARVISATDLDILIKKELGIVDVELPWWADKPKPKRLSKAEKILSDPGRFAASRGYDAIEVDIGNGKTNYVILNRTKVTVIKDQLPKGRVKSK